MFELYSKERKTPALQVALYRLRRHLTRGIAVAQVNTAIKCPSVSLLGFKKVPNMWTHTHRCSHTHTHSCVSLPMSTVSTWKTNRLMDGLQADSRQCGIINKGGWSQNRSSIQARFRSSSPLPDSMTTEPSCELCHRTQRLTCRLHHYLLSPQLFHSLRLEQ